MPVDLDRRVQHPPVASELRAVASGEPLDAEGAGVVTRTAVLGAGIAEADDEPRAYPFTRQSLRGLLGCGVVAGRLAEAGAEGGEAAAQAHAAIVRPRAAQAQGRSAPRHPQDLESLL